MKQGREWGGFVREIVPKGLAVFGEPSREVIGMELVVETFRENMMDLARLNQTNPEAAVQGLVLYCNANRPVGTGLVRLYEQCCQEVEEKSRAPVV